MGLKAEPGCLRAWVARLKVLSPKSLPPMSTRTWPVFSSMDTTAPWTMGASDQFPGPPLLWRSRLTRRTWTTSPGRREDTGVVARDLLPLGSCKMPHWSPQAKVHAPLLRRSGAATTRAVTARPLRGGYFR